MIFPANRGERRLGAVPTGGWAGGGWVTLPARCDCFDAPGPANLTPARAALVLEFPIAPPPTDASDRVTYRLERAFPDAPTPFDPVPTSVANTPFTD